MSPVPVHYRLDGSEGAPTLVLSNSLGSTTTMWEPQTPEFARRYRVVRYDHRGHGASPVPDGPYTLADLGGDVLALLDRLGVERTHFCGLSLGGMVGMWLAINAPERIDRLVLCCTSVDLEATAWHERAATVREHGPAAVASSVAERWFTPELRSRDADLVRRSEQMIAATPAEGYAACCEAIAAMDLSGHIGEIKAPTLVVAGARDPATPPEHAERIAAAIDGARHAVIPDAAHLANLEQSDIVTGLVLEHLENVE